MIAASLLSSGCTSDEEKCAEAQAAAEIHWKAYVDVLSAEEAEATAHVQAYTSAITGEVGFRLKQAAKAEANRLHDKTSSAWHRAYDARLKAACSQDSECSELRLAERAATHAIEQLKEPLATAQEALARVHGTAEQARAGARQVPEDDFRPAHNRAVEAGEQAWLLCSGE